MNQLSIIGFIGKDAEVKSLPNGTLVTKFSVATNKAWLDEPSGEWKSKTQWHYVSFYGERFADKVAGKLLKGTHVFVQGELNTREYSATIQVPNGKKIIDYEIKRLAVELKADTVRILDRNAAEPSDAVELPVDEQMPH
jgi:single-strand DNA-binding protein